MCTNRTKMCKKPVLFEKFLVLSRCKTYNNRVSITHGGEGVMRGKFIKKLTAYTLVAAMAVSTPMTAFASGLADYYWISDGEDKGTDTDTGTNSGTQTGTVSTTSTNTTVLPDNAANIRGIKISPAPVVMNAGEQEILTAEVLYADEEATSEEEKLAINNLLRWRTSDYNIVTVDAKKKDGMVKCPINAKKAGFATVTAGLDIDGDGTDDYLASVKVMVTREITKLEWAIPENQEFFAGHTYDLRDFILVDGDPAQEMDDITFSVIKADPKTATINGNGVLTVDKKAAKTADTMITVKAEISNTDVKPVEKELTIKKGEPVTKLTASNKGKAEVNFSKDGKLADPVENISVVPTPADTTDDIEWASNNEKIVTVEKHGDDQTKAVLTGVAVGKAKVTATATSGKKATFSVTVKADLISIDEVTINETNTTWSGKVTPVRIKRTPEQNVDKLKITVTDPTTKKASKFVKAKNNNIVPTANLKGNDEVTVDITVAPSNKKSTVASKELKGVTVKQSDVSFTGIARTKNGADINKKTERLNPSDRTVTYYATGITFNAPMTSIEEAAEAISWESSKESVATVANGKLKVVGEGSAKITVSSVYKDDKGRIKTIKKAFTVKSTPKCEEIVLKSDTAANMAGEKVTFNVKQQLPKKAADPITWYIDADGNGYKKVTDAKNATDKKLVYMIPANAPVGSEIKVLATTGSVATEATIYVTSPAKKVIVPESYKKGMTLNVGEMKVMEAPTVEPKSGTQAEPIVRYDVDKKGATVVKVLKLNNGSAIICGIGTGKATVSAVTASGKKANIKITVVEPANTQN